MANLYLSEELERPEPGRRITLAGPEARHAATVNRTRPGESVLIGNGRGLLAGRYLLGGGWGGCGDGVGGARLGGRCGRVGRGLLAGVELVADKESRAPFPRAAHVAESLARAALDAGLVVWPNVGHANGTDGDLVMLAPPFTITEREIDEIVERFREAMEVTERTVLAGVAAADRGVRVPGTSPSEQR